MSTAQLLATRWTHAGPVGPRDADRRSPWPLEERIVAGARAGFTGFDFGLDDLRAVQERDGFAGLERVLEENAITHVQIGLLTDWFAAGERRVASDIDRALALEAAAALGAWQITVAGDLSGDPVSPASMQEEFALLADQAAAVGAQLVLEPMGVSNLPTVEDGARFVQEVGHPHAGLLIDAFHVFRGGSTLESLRSAVDPAHLFAVELCDGSRDLPEGSTLAEDSADARLLPGEGAWDLSGLVGTLRQLGFDGPWGVEIASRDFRRLPLDEALGAAAVTARRTLGG